MALLPPCIYAKIHWVAIPGRRIDGDLTDSGGSSENNPEGCRDHGSTGDLHIADLDPRTVNSESRFRCEVRSGQRDWYGRSSPERTRVWSGS